MAIAQLTDARTDGSNVGQTTLDLVAAYGQAPVVQPRGSQNTAITRGAAAGMIGVFSATASPGSAATLTTNEAAITLIGGTGAATSVATTDLVYVNKPTAQAGLGIGNIRVSAAGAVGITFSNVTSGTLTPTASQVYGVIALRGMSVTTVTISPTAVAVSTTAEQQFTVTGLRAGELVQVNRMSAVQAGLDIVGARVVSNNLLGITFMNVTSGAVLTPTASTAYQVISLGGLDAQNNEIVYQVTGGTLAAVATGTTLQTALTITGLAASDMVRGVSKPTNQLGLALTGATVTAAGSVGLQFANVTSTGTLTPTANEVYGVHTWRPNPAAPLLVYSATLTPASIAANTTAEQGFTVTGLVSGSAVWVNKPTAQPGLGIAGCRVSAASTLAITFCNPTSAVITPTAGEVYVVGNFQVPTEVTGSSVFQTVTQVIQQNSVLTNAVRAGLVATGWMASGA